MAILKKASHKEFVTKHLVLLAAKTIVANVSKRFLLTFALLECFVLTLDFSPIVVNIVKKLIFDVHRTTVGFLHCSSQHFCETKRLRKEDLKCSVVLISLCALKSVCHFSILHLLPVRKTAC